MLFFHLFIRCFPERRRWNPKVERDIGVYKVSGALANSWTRREHLVGLKSSSSFHSKKQSQKCQQNGDKTLHNRAIY